MFCNECNKDLDDLSEGTDFTVNFEDDTATCVECVSASLMFHDAYFGPAADYDVT